MGLVTRECWPEAMEPQVLKTEWSIASSMQCKIEIVFYYKISVRVKLSFDFSYDAKIFP